MADQKEPTPTPRRSSLGSGGKNRLPEEHRKTGPEVRDPVYPETEAEFPSDEDQEPRPRKEAENS